ncbi:TPA: helix-turn-helix domain-containing protein [Providencia alcalifaciens]
MIGDKNNIAARVGHFLQGARKEKGLTGTELANLINVSQQQVSRYERGKSSLKLEQLNELLNALGKTWVEFLLYIETPQK